MSINYNNTYGAEIRNKVAVIQCNIDLFETYIKGIELDGLKSVCKDLITIADKLKDVKIEPEYKDLGVSNKWDNENQPIEYIDCVVAGHETQDRDLNIEGTYTEHKCEICKIIYRTDHSD